ncbi:hypothetical protein GCM10027614_68790 [Micromonospora vulcania]
MAVPVVDPSLNPVTDADPAEVDPTRRPGRGPARADLLALGAYVLLGVFVCLNYWGDVQGRVSSHLPTDHSWFEWLFAHGAYSVRHLENPLFTAQQNAPLGVNMMANTSLLGVTLPLAPLTMLLGPQVMYALYLGLALAATAGTGYWMLSRHLVRSRAAAFVGGAFLGFAPGIIHHANGQPNFVSNFLLPLIVVRVLRLGEPGRWRRNGLVLGALVTYQIFINEEMLLLTALACLVVVLAYAVQRPAATRARPVRSWPGSVSPADSPWCSRRTRSGSSSTARSPTAACRAASFTTGARTWPPSSPSPGTPGPVTRRWRRRSE